jgi:1-acyl-sn-glycerol-3-phosphate acyltransferase
MSKLYIIVFLISLLTVLFIYIFDEKLVFIRALQFICNMIMFITYSKFSLNYKNIKQFQKFNDHICDDVLNNKINVIGNVPKLDKPCIIMANHYNFNDYVVIKKALQIHFNVIAKSDIMSENNFCPGLGQLESLLFNSFHIIPYQRGNRCNGMLIKEKIKEQIANGNNVLIFPEGTTHRNGIPKEFKKGIFHLCHDNHIPILPLTLVFDKDIGLEKQDSFNIFNIFDVNATLHVHDIIQESDNMESLRKKVFNIIKSPFENQKVKL